MAKTQAPELTFEAVQVGHDEAVKLLGSNTHNRTLRAGRTNSYAIDMLKGNWRTTGDAVKFSKSGVLLDGQHRLAAIVQAATTGALEQGARIEPNPDLQLPLVVVRNLDDNAQEAMDIGAARSLKDILELNRQERNANHLASALRIIYAWTSGARKTIAKRAQVTNATLLDFFDADPDSFRQLVSTVSSEYQKGDHLLPPSVLALAHWLFEDVAPEDADAFFGRLQDGQDLHKGDAIYELRDALKRVRQDRGHRAIAYVLAITIKAWNAYRLGEKVNVLSFKMGGAHPELFPEPM
jgi:hypothetical protein